MQTKTSVILCTYNEEKIIKKTIDNLLNFNHDIEIIVVDDSSTDNIVKIIQELNQKEV